MKKKSNYLWKWIKKNKQWVFSGIGVFFISTLFYVANIKFPNILNPTENRIEIRASSYEIPKDVNLTDVSVTIPVEYVSGEVILEEKADILSFKVDESYLFKGQYLYISPSIEIKNINLNKKVINKGNPYAEITLLFEQFFIFIDPVYIKEPKKIHFGTFNLRIYYLDNTTEKFRDIQINMFFTMYYLTQSNLC